jgi:DNA-binding response OmpR family regulator
MKQVLIIEDDINIAELERDYLQLNGYQPEIAPDGEKGLKMALSGQYDAIVVDLMLPKKDGLEIIKEVRKNQEIPMIVVSARSEDIDKIRGLEYGADDYLTKPFSPAELAARIKSHLRRYERLKGNDLASEVINHKGLEINTASHQVFVSGKEIQLTAKEYELLVFLASNPNIVFTKEQLFDAVWGDEYNGDSATVSVHVQKVRKKVEKDPANPELIETLWGTGYRFNSKSYSNRV